MASAVLPAGCPTDVEFKHFLQSFDTFGADMMPDIVELGRGSYGVVYKYKGWVVKMMDLKDEDKMESFIRESNLYAALSKVNELKQYIVPYCFSYQDKYTHITDKNEGIEKRRGILVQEYIPSVTLQLYLRQNKSLTYEVGYALYRNLREGVNRLHAAGYIHRDLKPANILVRMGPEIPNELKYIPIIIDFGFGCPKPCNSTRRVGTPDYYSGNWSSRTNRLKNGITLYRKRAWLTEKNKPPTLFKWPWTKNTPIRQIVESRRKPMNVKSAKLIKTQPRALLPEYSDITDNYSLYLILKELYDKIDWRGHKEERDTENENLLRMVGKQTGLLAAQLGRSMSPLNKQKQLSNLKKLNRTRRLASMNISMNPNLNTASAKTTHNFWEKYKNKKRNEAFTILKGNNNASTAGKKHERAEENTEHTDMNRLNEQNKLKRGRGDT